MGKEFVNPNWHVILIHLPLGVFVLGMVIELFSFLYRHSTLRVVARGMIWLGALATVPTAMTGVYAFANVVRMELPADAAGAGAELANQPWHETVRVAIGEEEWRRDDSKWDALRMHVWGQAVATIVAALLVTVGFGASDLWRQRLQIPLMAGLTFALVAMIWGAYWGGEMVYRYGVAVNVVQEKGAVPEASVPSTSESAGKEQVEVKTGIERYVPPLQLHVLLAGFAVAAGLAALGMSMRVIATADQWRDPALAPARSLLDMEADTPRRGVEDADLMRALNPDPDAGTGPAGVPSARFWLITALLAVLAAGAGWWFLAGLDEVGARKPDVLWSVVVSKERRLYHVIVGGAIMVLPLVLALCARYARRSRFLLGLFAALLLIAVGVQVWLGVLLMFDTPDGSLFRFNTPAPAGGVPVTASVAP